MAMRVYHSRTSRKPAVAPKTAMRSASQSLEASLIGCQPYALLVKCDGPPEAALGSDSVIRRCPLNVRGLPETGQGWAIYHAQCIISRSHQTNPATPSGGSG